MNKLQRWRFLSVVTAQHQPADAVLQHSALRIAFTNTTRAEADSFAIQLGTEHGTTIGYVSYNTVLKNSSRHGYCFPARARHVTTPDAGKGTLVDEIGYARATSPLMAHTQAHGWYATPPSCVVVKLHTPSVTKCACTIFVQTTRHRSLLQTRMTSRGTLCDASSPNVLGAIESKHAL